MVLDVDKQINLYQHGEGDGDEGKIYKEKNHRNQEKKYFISAPAGGPYFCLTNAIFLMAHNNNCLKIVRKGALQLFGKRFL